MGVRDGEVWNRERLWKFLSTQEGWLTIQSPGVLFFCHTSRYKSDKHEPRWS